MKTENSFYPPKSAKFAFMKVVTWMDFIDAYSRSKISYEGRLYTFFWHRSATPEKILLCPTIAISFRELKNGRLQAVGKPWFYPKEVNTLFQES